MANSIALAPTTPQTAPAAHAKLPIMVNTGMIVPDEVWNFLDINDPRIMSNTREKARMTDVLKYFWEQHKGGDLGDVMLGMRDALNSFAMPKLGSNRLDQISQFVAIQRQIHELEKKKAAIVNVNSTTPR